MKEYDRFFNREQPEDEMTNKKCCENCWYGRAHTRPSQVPCPREAVKICGYWQRHPKLWLSLLPEEKGKFWWRLNSEDKEPDIIDIYEKNINGNWLCSDCDGDVLVKDLGGQFQGPIKPHD